MLRNTIVALATVAAIGAGSAAGAADYTGPRMDLSGHQPEFRVGFLGDESAQDILTRKSCLIPSVEAAYGVPA